MKSTRTALLLATVAALLTTTAAAAAEIDHLQTRELEIRLKTVTSGAAPVSQYRVWFTRNQGQSWEASPTLHAGAPPILFTAPSDGRYGFRVVAIDQSGTQASPPQPGEQPEYECVVDTTAPVLIVNAPTSGEPVYSGGDVVIDYQTHDENLGATPVRIEYRLLPDTVWQDIPDGYDLYPASARRPWFLPAVDGEVELRIIATDRAGNSATWMLDSPLQVIPFDGFTGSRAVAADDFSAFRRMPIFYRIPTFSFIERKTVEIWYRHESGPWQREVDPDRMSPYRFEARDEGRYFFYVRCISLNDVADRSAPTEDTPPDHRSVIDTLPPQGDVWISDGTSKVYHKAGTELAVHWDIVDTNLAAENCRLEYSIDGGGTWRVLDEQLSFQAGRGTYFWRAPLIEIEHAAFRVLARDLADNETQVRSRNSLHMINPTVDPEIAAEKYYQRGVYLARSGSRDSLHSAIEYLGVSLSYDARNANVWHDRGVLKMRLREPMGALEDLTQAHQLSSDIEITFSLVRAHLNVHRFGVDPLVNHLASAREILGTVSRVDIYKKENFRELQSAYDLLAKALEE